MADLDLAAIRDREESATFGPWIANGGAVILTAAAGDDDGMWVIGDATHTEDAEFVAHARTDLPALLDRVVELEAEREKHRSTVIDECIEHIRRNGFWNLTKDEALQMLRSLKSHPAGGGR